MFNSVSGTSLLGNKLIAAPALSLSHSLSKSTGKTAKNEEKEEEARLSIMNIKFVQFPQIINQMEISRQHYHDQVFSFSGQTEKVRESTRGHERHSSQAPPRSIASEWNVCVNFIL